MDRVSMIRWLEDHPQRIGRDPEALVERCEREVKRRAAEDAWLTAKEYVEQLEHEWEQSWGFPRASEAFVALEICRRLAHELEHLEPSLEPGAEDRLIGQKLLRSLDPAARREVGRWARELAQQEEHIAWQEVVELTRTHARNLVRRGALSRDLSPQTGNYFAKAAGVAHRLAEEYEAHAHPRPRRLSSH